MVWRPIWPMRFSTPCVRSSERGVTILLVEQNVHMTLEITHRAYVLEQGRVVLEGPSRELKQNEHVRKAYMGI